MRNATCSTPGVVLRRLAPCLALFLVACHRLPDQVPVQVNVSSPAGSDVFASTLLVDGVPVGKLNEGGLFPSSLTVERPKGELRKFLGSTFAVRTTGACGTHDIPLGTLDPAYRTVPDATVADRVKDSKAYSVILKAPARKQVSLLVDRGRSKVSVRVGELEIKGEDRVNPYPVPIDGCAAPPPIVVDGKVVGVVDPNAVAQLVNVEPGVCHVLQPVVYGEDTTTKRPPVHFPAVPVLKLDEVPKHVLERAPASMRIRGADGTVTNEFIREPCRS